MPQGPAPKPHEPEIPDMPGVKAEGDLLRTLRREVADLLQRNSAGFPGAQPVSFCRKHLETLKKQDFYLCEKSDGIRCLMYFTRDGDQEIHYLIDRRNDYYYVPKLHFPVPKDPSFQKFHTDTIIDGELVLDTVAPGKKALKYLVFDCLMIDNKLVMDRTLDKRLAYFRTYVFDPYRALCKAYPTEVQFFPFILEFKKMEFSYAVEVVFREVLPNLLHGNDGLIYTCRTTPYTCGTDQNILKWKPADENSIDFRLNLEFPTISREDLDPDDVDSDTESETPDYEAMPRFLLSAYHGDSAYKYYGDMYMDEQEWESLKAMGVPLDDEIVECRLDEEKRWRFMRFRRDKKDANHISTVHSVIESIQDGVGQDELIKGWKEVRDAWKARNAQPPK